MKNKTIYTPSNDAEQQNNNDISPNSKEDEYAHGKHPNSLKVLKKHQYPKGISGNVLGKKPKFQSLGKALQKLGEQETLNYSKESLGTRKEQVLQRIWADAMRGDMKKIQLLAWLGCLD